MTPPEQRIREALRARITDCLAKGGLWNMEVMEAGKVRDLLIECREALLHAAEPPAPPTLSAEQVERASVEANAKSLGKYEYYKEFAKCLNALLAPQPAATESGSE